MPAGLTPAETLVKEAEEEAAIPASLARQAVPRSGGSPMRWSAPRGSAATCCTATTSSCRTISRPDAADGEVEAFELWPIGRVMQAVRDTDDFKFNVNLVLIDLFRRLQLILISTCAAAASAPSSSRP